RRISSWKGPPPTMSTRASSVDGSRSEGRLDTRTRSSRLGPFEVKLVENAQPRRTSREPGLDSTQASACDRALVDTAPHTRCAIAEPAIGISRSLACDARDA